MIYVGEHGTPIVTCFRFIPPPVNHAYRIASVGGRRDAKHYMMMANHAERFKKLTTQYLKLMNLRLPEDWQYLRVDYLFLFEKSEMMTKGKNCKNTLQQIDVSNLFKLLEDSIHEHIEIDDRYVISLFGHKRFVPDGSLSNLWFHPVKTKDYRSRSGVTIVRIEGVHSSVLEVSDNLKAKFAFDHLNIFEGDEPDG